MGIPPTKALFLGTVSTSGVRSSVYAHIPSTLCDTEAKIAKVTEVLKEAYVTSLSTGSPLVVDEALQTKLLMAVTSASTAAAPRVATTTSPSAAAGAGAAASSIEPPAEGCFTKFYESHFSKIPSSAIKGKELSFDEKIELLEKEVHQEIDTAFNKKPIDELLEYVESQIGTPLSKAYKAELKRLPLVEAKERLKSLVLEARYKSTLKELNAFLSDEKAILEWTPETVSHIAKILSVYSRHTLEGKEKTDAVIELFHGHLLQALRSQDKRLTDKEAFEKAYADTLKMPLFSRYKEILTKEETRTTIAELAFKAKSIMHLEWICYTNDPINVTPFTGSKTNTDGTLTDEFIEHFTKRLEKEIHEEHKTSGMVPDSCFEKAWEKLVHSSEFEDVYDRLQEKKHAIFNDFFIETERGWNSVRLAMHTTYPLPIAKKDLERTPKKNSVTILNDIIGVARNNSVFSTNMGLLYGMDRMENISLKDPSYKQRICDFFRPSSAQILKAKKEAAIYEIKQDIKDCITGSTNEDFVKAVEKYFNREVEKEKAIESLAREKDPGPVKEKIASIEKEQREIPFPPIPESDTFMDLIKNLRLAELYSEDVDDVSSEIGAFQMRFLSAMREETPVENEGQAYAVFSTKGGNLRDLGYDDILNDSWAKMEEEDFFGNMKYLHSSYPNPAVVDNIPLISESQFFPLTYAPNSDIDKFNAPLPAEEDRLKKTLEARFSPLANYFRIIPEYEGICLDTLQDEYTAKYPNLMEKITNKKRIKDLPLEEKIKALFQIKLLSEITATIKKDSIFPIYENPEGVAEKAISHVIKWLGEEKDFAATFVDAYYIVSTMLKLDTNPENIINLDKTLERWYTTIYQGLNPDLGPYSRLTVKNKMDLIKAFYSYLYSTSGVMQVLVDMNRSSIRVGGKNVKESFKEGSHYIGTNFAFISPSIFLTEPIKKLYDSLKITKFDDDPLKDHEKRLSYAIFLLSYVAQTGTLNTLSHIPHCFEHHSFCKVGFPPFYIGGESQIQFAEDGTPFLVLKTLSFIPLDDENFSDNAIYMKKRDPSTGAEVDAIRGRPVFYKSLVEVTFMINGRTREIVYKATPTFALNPYDPLPICHALNALPYGNEYPAKQYYYHTCRSSA